MRLFVAIAVPEPVRRTLDAAVAPLRRRYDGLRWTPAANWHLTLVFLGEVPVGVRLRAQVALGAVARAARPCAIAVDGRLGRFGDRVLWAAVVAPDGSLSDLAAGVADELRSNGVAVDDRSFRAHLTLARARRGHRIPPKPRRLVALEAPLGWTASTVALMASQTGPAGSRYRTVATWPLGTT